MKLLDKFLKQGEKTAIVYKTQANPPTLLTMGALKYLRDISEDFKSDVYIILEDRECGLTRESSWSYLNMLTDYPIKQLKPSNYKTFLKAHNYTNIQEISASEVEGKSTEQKLQLSVMEDNFEFFQDNTPLELNGTTKQKLFEELKESLVSQLDESVTPIKWDWLLNNKSLKIAQFRVAESKLEVSFKYEPSLYTWKIAFQLDEVFKVIQRGRLKNIAPVLLTLLDIIKSFVANTKPDRAEFTLANLRNTQASVSTFKDMLAKLVGNLGYKVAFTQQANKVIFSIFNKNITEKIEYVKNSLGISRNNMPQIKGKDVPDFINKLNTVFGVSSHNKTFIISQLKPTQKEINLNKVNLKIDAYQKNPKQVSKPFIVSKDGYILDGHHLWAALTTINPATKVSGYQVNTDMKSLIKLAQKYDNVTYKGINESSPDLIPDDKIQYNWINQDLTHHSARFDVNAASYILKISRAGAKSWVLDCDCPSDISTLDGSVTIETVKAIIEDFLKKVDVDYLSCPHSNDGIEVVLKTLRKSAEFKNKLQASGINITKSKNSTLIYKDKDLQ